MKLMKKVALIFICATIISTLAYYALGRVMIETASSGELERGPGRTNGAISKIEGEVNKMTSQAREFGEYFEIANKVTYKYGAQDIKGIINIEKKIEKAPITNMIIVDNDFKFINEVKITNLDINDPDIQNVLNQSKEIINSKENIKKGFFGGVITTEKLAYIVGAKRINDRNPENNKYAVIINPMDDEFMKEMDKTTGRDLEIIKYSENMGIDYSIAPMELYGRVFNYTRNDDSIDIFTKFNKIGTGPEYYIKLRDDRTVRNNAIKNIGIIMSITTILTILCNLLLYKFIKKKVVNRIVNINNAVNNVTAGVDLEMQLKKDDECDEISILTEDLNNVFNELKNYADNLEYIGSHDLLTSLINRNKLNEYIGELKNNSDEFALFFIDLDNFKSINDTLGHNFGDQLLCQVAKELEECTSDENVIISRIGGDEFILVRKGENNKEEIDNLAIIILNKLNRPYKINNYTYEIKASMGISLYPEHSNEDVTLMQYADIAMYNSKKSGGNRYNIFNKKMLEPLEIENKMKNAIKNEEFEAYYQPIYNVKDKKIIGAEALIRWKTKDGMIYPDKFIPIAKKTGYIVDIDMFILRQSIKLCREWIDKGEKEFYVSINASKRFLKQENFVELIKKELEIYNVPTSSLKLEITEDEIIDNIEETKELLNDIRRMGVNVYLDDFGTGYSSFNHIKNLPVDVIKIDRSLLIDIEEDSKAKSIVETMINLCHNLDLKVVCEGIEDIEQVEILKRLDCDNIQGYYFSRPLPKQEFDKFLKEF